MGCHPSHWRTPSFFRGVGWNHQPYIYIFLGFNRGWPTNFGALCQECPAKIFGIVHCARSICLEPFANIYDLAGSICPSMVISLCVGKPPNMMCSIPPRCMVRVKDLVSHKCAEENHMQELPQKQLLPNGTQNSLPWKTAENNPPTSIFPKPQPQNTSNYGTQRQVPGLEPPQVHDTAGFSCRANMVGWRSLVSKQKRPIFPPVLNAAITWNSKLGVQQWWTWSPQRLMHMEDT